MTSLINLTPHALALRAVDGSDTIVPPSGAVARVTCTPGGPSGVGGVPVPIYGADVLGAVDGLPAPVEGVLYIVSAIVGAACVGRTDVLVPGTGPSDGAVRNDKGHIVAVTRLKRVG